jgi:hypothetical protein
MVALGDPWGRVPGAQSASAMFMRAGNVLATGW